jgi:hypothetical protein
VGTSSSLLFCFGSDASLGFAVNVLQTDCISELFIYTTRLYKNFQNVLQILLYCVRTVFTLIPDYSLVLV